MSDEAPEDEEGQDLLYRRVPVDMLIYSSEGGCRRVKSALFKQKPLMSVSIGAKLDGREPTAVLEGYPGQWLVCFPEKAALDCGLTVEWTPQCDDPAHGDVSPRTDSIARILHEKSDWVVSPSDACPRPDGQPTPPSDG